MPNPVEQPLDRQRLLASLDETITNAMALRVQIGGLLETMDTPAWEAIARDSQEYQQARRDSSDAIVALAVAVESDDLLRDLVHQVESAYEEVIVQTADLAFRAGLFVELAQHA